jgi:excisionase family DNA binding protein
MNDRVLTVPDVALLLKMSKAKVYILVQKGNIPYLKFDRNIRILESDLQKWLEKCRVNVSGKTN